MMDERWTSQKAPLLVLSCANNSELEEQKLTCVDVVEELKLCEMNRHWQVNKLYFMKPTVCSVYRYKGYTVTCHEYGP